MRANLNKLNSINPLREYANKIADKGNKNKTHNIEINGKDTHIPNNLPIAIIGDKGSGKSTLLKSMMELTYKNIFNHIYFIYSSLSWDEELPAYIIKIDVNNCEEFLTQLFEAKAIFNSYIKFFNSLDFKELKRKQDKGELNEDDFLNKIDTNIIKYNQEVINIGINPEEKINKIIDLGYKIINKFSKNFYIGNVMIEGFKPDDLDALFIDDIAIASKVLFKSIKDNDIYKYFTLTRHMRLFICLAGQQVEQIPKPLRREIMTWLFSKNSVLDLLSGVLPLSTIKKIENEQIKLPPYHFVIYNCVDGYIGII